MLGRVLERLEAAEVDGGFDLGVVATDTVELDVDAERAPVGGGPQRLGQSAVDEERRVDAVGEVPQLLDGVLHAPGQHLEHLRRCRGVVGEDVPGQAEVHGKGDQVLLSPVVEVALDLAALGVGGGDDAGP